MSNSSNDHVKAKRSLKETYWPNVSTPEEARKTARHGMWAAYVGGGLSIFAVIIAFFSSDVREFLSEVLEVTPGEQDVLFGLLVMVMLEGIIFIGLGFAIGKMSRIAAVFASVLFLLDKIAMPPANFMGIIFTLAFFWLYVLGIRGTFAWHRLK